MSKWRVPTNPELQELRRCLSYDPGTGVVTWIVRNNNVVIGKGAGCKRKDGYRDINS